MKINKLQTALLITVLALALASFSWFIWKFQAEKNLAVLPDFKWQVPRTSPEQNYEQKWTETNSGSSFTTEDTAAKEAYQALQEKKKSITNKQVLAALELADATYIDPSKMTTVIKANGRKNERSLYQGLWHYMATSYPHAKIQEDYVLTFQGKSYPLKSYAPMALKINTNALQRAHAYNLKGYKVEGNKITFKLGVRTVDEYQYFVHASYESNFSSFFEPLAEFTNSSSKTKDVSPRIAAKFLYWLAAVGYKEDGSVDLYGMGYGSLRNLYFQVTIEEGQVKIDDKNLGRLFQLGMGEKETGLEKFFEDESKKAD
ncbi:hypothetical protein [Streptococcus oricebi]|uniref:Lipoprotein n=1 Tax=Streptococcus oricebi TaxID=1547447 RepID=A0ABS5B4W3_9STRE|nr:hypothetical protein [Streptococcus oricebi]MBP2623860.1 hypothetical protein [Streptococcus oricebi]